MRDHDGQLSFAPRLPQRLTRLAFGVCFCERRLRVEVTDDQARYTLVQGPPLPVTHHGQAIEITDGTPVRCPIAPIAARESPRQPGGRSPARRQPRA